MGTLELGQNAAVPVLDLAISSEFAVKMLAMEGAAKIDFPGSSWSISLMRSVDTVTVSLSQDRGTSKCSSIPGGLYVLMSIGTVPADPADPAIRVLGWGRCA